MKSYIQGLFTGGVLIFAFMVLTGSNYTTYDADDIMDKLDDIESNISDMESNISSIYYDVSSIESDVSSIKSNVSSIKLYGVDCY